MPRPPFPFILLAALWLGAVPAGAAPEGSTPPEGAPVAPRLSVPAEVTAGRTLSITATTTTVGQTCMLLATSPIGQLRRTALTGLRPRGTGARGSVLPTTRPGLWTLQLRCGSRASQVSTVRVLAGRVQAGRNARLVTAMRTYRFSSKRPSALRTPAADQDGGGAPTFRPEPLDGLGASTSERAARALQWALRQVGRTDYALWCLRFVANAYNAPRAGYPTAQAAADALELRGRGGSPANAPAGSLVFFHVPGKGGESYGHVGLSLGDGRMISAQETVRIERIRDVPMWKTNYLGWAYPPAAWPGFPPPQPSTPALSAQAERPNTADASLPPAPEATPAPPASEKIRRPIVTDNRVAAGLDMVEDTQPLRLHRAPEAYCYSRGCVYDLDEHPGYFSGGVWDAAVCQIKGHQITNGSYASPDDDDNPELYTSDLWYGVELNDGRFGYVPEVWIRAQDRGGLGLPACDPVAPWVKPLAAIPSGLVIGYAELRLTTVADNRYVSGADDLVEDTYPLQLQTRPWTGCFRIGCVVPEEFDAGRLSGGTWSDVVCWTQGDRWTNSLSSVPFEPDHPGLRASRRWYGIALTNGKLGYVNEVYVQEQYHGDRGLPYCPPYPDQLVEGW